MEIDYTNELKKYMIANEKHFHPIVNQETLKEVYELFFKDIIPKIDEKNFDLLLNLGKYYFFKGDYESAIKYYSLINLINNKSANNRLSACHDQLKDYENMKTYALKAIEQNNPVAMNNLGKFYEEQKDIENMLKYYLMKPKKNIDAIDKISTL